VGRTEFLRTTGVSLSKRVPTGQRYSFPERLDDTTLHAWKHKDLPVAGSGADSFVQRLFLAPVLDNLSNTPAAVAPEHVDQAANKKRAKAITGTDSLGRASLDYDPSDKDEPSEPIAA
jgi:hypothetical protein